MSDLTQHAGADVGANFDDSDGSAKARKSFFNQEDAGQSAEDAAYEKRVRHLLARGDLTTEQQIEHLKEAATGLRRYPEESTPEQRLAMLNPHDTRLQLQTLMGDLTTKVDEALCVAAVSDRKNGAPVHEFRNNKHDLIEIAVTGIARLAAKADGDNAQHAALVPVIFGPQWNSVTQRLSAKEENCKGVLCAIVEIDEGDIFAAYAKLRSLRLNPTLEVMSGGLTADGLPKLHLYLAYESPLKDIERAKRINRRLAKLLNADASFSSTVHPIRVAGGLHRKGAALPTRIMAVRKKRYAPEDIEKILDEVAPEPKQEHHRRQSADEKVGNHRECLDHIEMGRDGIRAQMLRFAGLAVRMGWDADDTEARLADALNKGFNDGHIELPRFNTRVQEMPKIVRDAFDSITSSESFMEQEDRRQWLAELRELQADAAKRASRKAEIGADIAKLTPKSIGDDGDLSALDLLFRKIASILPAAMELKIFAGNIAKRIDRTIKREIGAEIKKIADKFHRMLEHSAKGGNRTAEKPEAPLDPVLKDWPMPHPDLAGGGQYVIDKHCGAPFVALQHAHDGELGPARPLFTPLAMTHRVKYVEDGVEGHRWTAYTSEGIQSVDLPASMALSGYGNELISTFRDLGVRFEDEGQKFIKRWAMAAAPDTPPVSILSKPGWYPNIGYMAPNGELFATVDEPPKVELAEGNPLKGKERGGTLEGAKDVAEAVLTSEHEAMQMGLFAGPVGCLLHLAEMDSFTMYFGGETTKGKSTSQKVKASSWGTPELNAGLNRVAHGTPNARENQIVHGNASGTDFDETRAMAGSEVEDLIFRVQGGKTKERAQRTGEANRKTREWRTCVSMSGETGVMQKIEADGNSAAGGTAARVLFSDVSSAPKLAPEIIQRIEKFNTHYGWAGPAVVEQLIKQGYAKEPHRVAEDIGVYAQELAGSNASEIQLRAAKMYAAIWLSGRLLQDAGFIPRSFNVEGLLRRQWAARHAADRDDGKTVVDRALVQLRERIIQAEVINGRNDGPSGCEEDETESSTKLWDRYTGALLAEVFEEATVGSPCRRAPGFYCVPTSTIAELVGQIVDKKRVSEELAKRDLLIKPGDATRNIHKVLPGGGRIDHLRIKARFFRADGADADGETAAERAAWVDEDMSAEELEAALKGTDGEMDGDLGAQGETPDAWLEAYHRKCEEFRQRRQRVHGEPLN